MLLYLLFLSTIWLVASQVNNIDDDLTFPDGRTFSFDSSQNYFVLGKKNSETLSVTRIRLYSLDQEITSMVYTASSINPSALADCQMTQANGDQACYTKTDGTDVNPLIIVNTGSATFDRVKLYNYGTTTAEKDKLLTAEMQFWIGRSYTSSTLRLIFYMLIRKHALSNAQVEREHTTLLSMESPQARNTLCRVVLFTQNF